MSTISALSPSVTTQRLSPRGQMDQDISAAVQAGVLSQTDAGAIETALDKIDSALQSGSNQTGSALDPRQIKERVGALIDQQVKDGTLTQDQASELKAFFEAGPGGKSGDAAQAGSGTSSSTGASGMGGVGGGGGGGGSGETTDTTTDTDGDGVPDYIDPQPTVYNASDTDSTTNAGNSSAGSQSGNSDSDGDGDDSKLSALKAFLHNLRQPPDQATYAVGGSGQAVGSTSGQIVNQYA